MRNVKNISVYTYIHTTLSLLRLTVFRREERKEREDVYGSIDKQRDRLYCAHPNDHANGKIDENEHDYFNDVHTL